MQKQNLENQKRAELTSVQHLIAVERFGLGKTPQNTKHGSSILLIYILDLN